MKVLGVAVLLVAVVYWWLSTRHPPGIDPVALWVVTLVGIVTTVAVLGMLLFMHGWTIRATGLALILSGIAVYGIGSLVLIRGWVAMVDGKRINDLILALWIVGTPAMAYGLGRMFWEEGQIGWPRGIVTRRLLALALVVIVALVMVIVIRS